MSIGQVGPRLLSWYASLGTPAGTQPAAPQQQPAAPQQVPFGVDVYTPGVQVRHLPPPLMRPMAVASRASPAAGSAVSSVLAVLADFAD